MTPDNTLAEVREALFACQNELLIFDDIANCEHEVGICACSYWITIEKSRKALTKLDAMIEAQGWQPIETAPKDGSVLLLYQPINKSIHDPPIAQYFEYSVCRWENGVWRIENEYCGDISTINAPTHWMPLPKPPTQGDGR